MSKIKVKNPIVELDGDEMTRVIWEFIKKKLILQYSDLGFEYYEYNVAPSDESDSFLSHIVADVSGGPVCEIALSGDEICLDELNMPEASLWLEV